MPNSISDIRYQNVSEIPCWEDDWDAIVSTSPDAWYRHARILREYTLAATAERDPGDDSFFIFKGDRLIGLAPVLFSRVADDNGYQALEAGYYGSPLPWPCFQAEFQRNQELELSVFDEIERRARARGAERLHFLLFPRPPSKEDEHRFKTLIDSRNYIDGRHPSHWVQIKDDSNSNVRPRYKRYIKKFKDQYNLSFIEGRAVDDEFAQTFMDIHIKDAGGQFRPRDSYFAQANLARDGLGFFAVATSVSSGKIAGMLLVILFNGQAHDASVAIDPEHEKNYVSHLLKWMTIETLIERKVAAYELGPKAELPTWQRIPSKNNYGISFFKDGWARGGEITLLVADKFLSRDALNLYSRGMTNRLAKYFKC